MRLLMETRDSRHDNCQACRYWALPQQECRRWPPTLVGVTEGAWPRTPPDAWCGEWEGTVEATLPLRVATPASSALAIAAELLLSRLAPGLDVSDPVGQVTQLLDILPPDARMVVIRAQGLDGRPVTGIKEVAREIGMSRNRVQALMAAADKRLQEALSLLLLRQQRKRESVLMTIKRIGKVTILAEIGRGANSLVYRVIREADGNEYALKVVPLAKSSDHKYLIQAQHEFRVGQMLKHPALMRVYGFETETDWLFRPRRARLLSEFAPGHTIDQYPALPMPVLLQAFQQVAGAVAHMHENGVVHADLKPCNILLSQYGRVKVVDFGLARLGNERKNRLQGTPEYMAPETCTRRVINERTDLYNLGATMYRVATRRFPPYLTPGLGLTERTFDRLLTPVEEFNPEAPPEFCDLIHRCLRYDPDRRPKTAAEVHRTLIGLANAAGGTEPTPR
jgi:tRNA A-37 threonylcarbamoyl transferase component Bud32